MNAGAGGADSDAGILEGGGARVVIHKVLRAVPRVPLFPAGREGQITRFLYLYSRIFPLSSPGKVGYSGT